MYNYNTYAYVPPATSYQSYYPPAGTAASSNTALVTVYVPRAGAEVWFGDSATQQTGTVRQFQSPPLTPGRDYTYRITARWTGPDGRPVVQARDVTVRAGSQVTVDFTRPNG